MTLHHQSVVSSWNVFQVFQYVPHIIILHQIDMQTDDPASLFLLSLTYCTVCINIIPTVVPIVVPGAFPIELIELR